MGFSSSSLFGNVVANVGLFDDDNDDAVTNYTAAGSTPSMTPGGSAPTPSDTLACSSPTRSSKPFIRLRRADRSSGSSPCLLSCTPSYFSSYYR